MWSERDQATIEAYRTFACEIALYAYNDYIGNDQMVNEIGERYFRETCFDCEHAEWDYETYYGTTRKEWFVCGCKRLETIGCIYDEEEEE